MAIRALKKLGAASIRRGLSKTRAGQRALNRNKDLQRARMMKGVSTRRLRKLHEKMDPSNTSPSAVKWRKLHLQDRIVTGKGSPAQVGDWYQHLKDRRNYVLSVEELADVINEERLMRREIGKSIRDIEKMRRGGVGGLLTSIRANLGR